MESLRWILLIAGIIFVLVIYVLGRNRRRRRNDSVIENTDESLPEFSAQNLDDLDEGVGEVRIVTGENFIVDDDLSGHVGSAGSNDEAKFADENTENETHEDAIKGPSDIIVLYILAKEGEELIGSQINSSAQAMGLSFGEMNIFHYRPNNRNVFSLANMLEPGAFDADTIHDLKTSGLTVFMQITGSDPLDDLTEMLQRSYQLAGLLDAILCNRKRKPLTEQDAEDCRTQVSKFIA